MSTITNNLPSSQLTPLSPPFPFLSKQCVPRRLHNVLVIKPVINLLSCIFLVNLAESYF
ncbi:hypothetical protein BDZ94DRAFT_1253968 [Collybia nuda]|uniref:Uncharacterized protein n=1 Tax=Collybia nuda TaxID=64659 RepID=A0A9P5YBQ1_9AGAR|nr:hypothetical protein BDZ94DRAFT_1253968 [Collybia nuda]